MHYPYHLIKELSGTKKTKEQLAHLLLKHSFEVEGIEKFPHGIDGVIIGRVLSVKQHPNADKLHITEIEVGKKDIRTIVCGAPNIAEGQKVAVALPGTDLPGGIHITTAKLRGIESNGMVCSAKELGLGSDHSGILVLDEDAPVGASLVKFIGIDDYIIEAKILPDRGSDAIAYLGFAREISALDKHTPHLIEKKVKPLRVPAYNRAPKVVIEDKKACLRYVGLSFSGITLGESPIWLKVQLILAGLRPINNIVDITNYLMLLTGQPLHAFDTDTLSGAITIRKAKKNEKLMLLTGEIKKLSLDDLVIADTKKTLALAGVMGGKGSGISETTKNIFLEIATFDASTIRRTKNRHNLSTDASFRYERGLDPNLPRSVASEAVHLITSIAHGKLIGMRDIYPGVVKPWKVLLSVDRVEKMLGIKIPLFEMVQYLALLGLSVKKVVDQKVLEVIVPTRRPDLRNEWDLIEEIGRMRGYDAVPAIAPLLPLLPCTKNPLKTFERETKSLLAHIGFDEIMTYSFYGEKEASFASLDLHIHPVLANPLTADQQFLRVSLLPLLLSKTKENLRSFSSFDIFEWGSIFTKQIKPTKLGEQKSLGLISVLPKKSDDGEAFFTLKGKVMALLSSLHIDHQQILFEEKKSFPDFALSPMFHETRSAIVSIAGKPIGMIGEFHPRTLKSFGLENRLAGAEFFVEALLALKKDAVLFTPLQRFPYAVRDISLICPKQVTVRTIETIIKEAGSPLLKHIELFDIYKNGEEKSFAFHLSFGAEDRTLSSSEMDASFDKIVALAEKRLSARLRL